MRAFGKAATAATTKVPIEATTYTEQSVNGQRSLVSTSASDAAAGTGARTVQVVYYSWDGTTMLGPFSEVVTLNGVTPVATRGSNICFVERMVVLTAGSGGVAAGTISVNTKADGTGSNFGSIATGDVRTWWAHHYVTSKRACRILGMIAGGPVGALNAFDLMALPYPGVEQPVTSLGVVSVQSVELKDPLPTPIAGPARVRAYVTPAAGAAQTVACDVVFVDDSTVLA